MLTMRQRIGAIVAGVLLLLAIIIGAWMLLRKKPEVAPVVTITPPIVQVTPAVPEFRQQPNVVAEELPPAEQNELVARQLARDFVERFRSFSNQNENAHIASVLPFVTESMERYVRKQAGEDAVVYEGMTTTVLSTKTESYTDVKAVIAVSVQERRFVGGTDTVVYRTGTVALKKIDGTWYVDGLFWNEAIEQ